MNQHKHTSDLDLGRGWLNRAAEMLDACEDHRSDAEFARAAAAIGNGFIALAHAERAMRSSATLDAAAERVRRASAEARPHDDEPKPGDVVRIYGPGHKDGVLSTVDKFGGYNGKAEVAAGAARMTIFRRAVDRG